MLFHAWGTPTTILKPSRNNAWLWQLAFSNLMVNPMRRQSSTWRTTSILWYFYYASLPYFSGVPYGFGNPLPSFQSAGFGIEPILGWGCVASFTVASNGWQSRNWSSTAESPQSNSGGNSPCDALEGSFLRNPTLTHQSSYPMMNNLINLVGISMAKYDSNKIKPLTDW